MEVLDGRVVLLSDNSPVALLLPSAFQDFMNVTEDRYNRFEIASFERLIRYAAMVFSFLLSGTYLAVIGFHTMILPTNLICPLRSPGRACRFRASWKCCLWNWRLN